MRKITQKRHIAKTISWRIIGTIDTITIAWIVSGNPMAGLKIGLSEVCTKMLLYYLHEWGWARINLEKYSFFKKSQRRHVTKTVTWRVIGTMDTIFLSWLITGNPMAALKIGMTEVFTKMILYYLHERVWYKIKFGVVEVEDEEDLKKIDGRLM
jgi:uncharacterized membrane protein